MTPRHFVLLDRDGTINFERHYLSDPQQVELLPDAARGLRLMQGLGLGLLVVTNQSGLARGYFDEACLKQIHLRLSELLAAEQVHLDGIFYCPHHPDDHCSCRKPGTALAHAAVQQFGFELTQCFVVGDKVCDIDFGRRLSATTLLVRTGYGAATLGAEPAYTVDNLYEAALIMQRRLLSIPR